MDKNKFKTVQYGDHDFDVIEPPYFKSTGNTSEDCLQALAQDGVGGDYMVYWPIINRDAKEMEDLVNCNNYFIEVE